MATSGRGAATDSSILQYVLGKAAYTAPAGCYAALFSTTATADNGTFTELSGSGYARATIDAANASAAWSPAAGYGIYDSASGGILLYWGTFGSATTVGSGATASFAAGALKVTEA